MNFQVLEKILASNENTLNQLINQGLPFQIINCPTFRRIVAHDRKFSAFWGFWYSQASHENEAIVDAHRLWCISASNKGDIHENTLANGFHR